MKHICLLLSFAFLCACSGGKSPAQEQKGPSQQAYGVIISQSQMGQSDWLLTTKHASFYDEQKFADLENPALIFNKEGVQDSTVKSKEGVYDMQNNLITLSGNVVGVSEKEGAEIKTEKVYYDVARKLIWTDNDVLVTRGGVSVKGKGIKASSDLSEIEIIKQETRLPAELGELKAALRSYDKKI